MSELDKSIRKLSLAMQGENLNWQTKRLKTTYIPKEKKSVQGHQWNPCDKENKALLALALTSLMDL